jgi:hypothetical protein
VFAGAELAEVFDGSGVSWRSRKGVGQKHRDTGGRGMPVFVEEERKGDI